MLESFKSGQLSDAILFAKWSGKMDVIAICYAQSETKIELRRMDWTKVNSISISSPAQHFCFSPDGKTLLVATTSRELFQFDIETAKLISSTLFSTDITCISYAQTNGINVFAVGNSDNTITIYSDIHFALCNCPLDGGNAEEISIHDGNVYVLLDDMVTVKSFELPFLSNNAELIKTVSSSVNTFWINNQKIENSIVEFDELWKTLWNESKEITENARSFAKSFLLGLPLDNQFSENHLQHLEKQVETTIEQLRDVIASDIVPSFIEMDKASKEIIMAVQFSPKEIGIQIDFQPSTENIKQCLARLETLTQISNCFKATFEYLQGKSPVLEILEKYNILSGNYVEFLAKYCNQFKIQEIEPIEIVSSIMSSPTFAAQSKGTITINGNFSSLNYSFVSSIVENKATIINLATSEEVEYSTNSQMTLAYPFEDGCVGCFSQNDSKSYFTMFGRESEEEGEEPDTTPLEILLTDVIAYIVSNRRIALVQSSTSYFTVVDLESVAESEEEDAED